MKFGDLKVGDIVYCIHVNNSIIDDGHVKKKFVSDACNYKGTNNVEIHLSDDTMIIPGNDEEVVVRGLGAISNIIEPFNFVIYSASYNGCVDKLKSIVSDKLLKLGEDYRKINVQMTKLCMMSMMVSNMEEKSSVVLEPIYAD